MNLWIDMFTSITPQIVAGMLGGLVGASRTMDIKRYGIQISITLIFAALIASGAVADVLTRSSSINSVWVIGLVDIFVGMFIGALMDAVDIASPKLATKVVSVVGNATVDKLTTVLNNKNNKEEDKQDESSS